MLGPLLAPCLISFLPLKKSYPVFVLSQESMCHCKVDFASSTEKREVSNTNSHDFQISHFPSSAKGCKHEEESHHLKNEIMHLICTCGLNSIPLYPLGTPFSIFYFSHYTGLDQVLYKHAMASKLISQMPGFSYSYLFSTLH